nr:hypothetical transcript [Hymenolepis microstoma]
MYTASSELLSLTVKFDSDKSAAISQLCRTRSKRKAYISVKYAGQTTPYSDQLLIERPTSRPQSIPTTSIDDCPLEPSIRASVPSSLQETPVHHNNNPINEII